MSGACSSYHILGSQLFFLFSRSSKLFQFYHFKPPSNSSQALNLILFIFHFSCFHYRSSHGGSSSFNSSSKSSSRFLLELKHSSSCFQLQSFLPYLSGGVMSFLSIPSCFMIHELSRMRYLKPSFSLFMRSCQPFNLCVDLSWVVFHLKAFPKDCCYYGAYNDPSSSFILSVK